LSSEEARQRFARYGSNLLQPQKRSNVPRLLLAQFKSPLILILLFATGLSVAALQRATSLENDTPYLKHSVTKICGKQ
jgi:magnesium-transporting ATPase (P-type)